MSDFLLDIRPSNVGEGQEVAEFLKFYEDIETFRYDFEKLSLTLTRPNDGALWGPVHSRDAGVLVSLSGRVALEESQWERASSIPGDGGLACKVLLENYLNEGEGSLGNLNGNFAVVLYDQRKQQLFVVLDRSGMYPCFAHKLDEPGFQVVSSHPDLLAESAGCATDFDQVSMAEFLMTGKVSYPHTYYRRVRALEFAAVHRFDLNGKLPRYEGSRKTFSFDYKFDVDVGQEELARSLGKAFTQAMGRRTLPVLGKTAIAMSGGLDSRALLCSVQDRSRITTFCFFDEENVEYKTAKAITRDAGVELVPLKRQFDHYGDTAEKGVRIFGGMGDIFNNHLLGFREVFQELEIENLITGFYCDYYFKGLALDRKKQRFTQLEEFSKYRHEWYRPCFFAETSYREEVKARLDRVIPPALRMEQSEQGRMRVAEKRVFPLCYEPDNAETTIPQRVMPFFLPMADNDILELYNTIPPRFKLNHTCYSKMVAMQCGEEISRIPNINTGARVDASVPNIVFHRYISALRSRFDKLVKPSMALSGSWPNFEYYIHHSSKIAALWEPSCGSIREVFEEILGSDPFERPLESYRGNEVDFVGRVLTLKLWLENRLG